MFKVNNKNTRTRRDISSELKIKHLNDANGLVLVSSFLTFEHISDLVQGFLLLTLNMLLSAGTVLINSPLLDLQIYYI